MKKILKALLITLLCVLSIIFLVACGDEEESEGEKSPLAFEISKDGSYYTVTGIGNYTDTSLVLPSTHEGLPVKEIGVDAFANNETITEVTIPKSITVIGYASFQNCPNLAKISFEEGSALEVIGIGAFKKCRALTSIKIPSSVTEIGASAFEECVLISVVEIESIEAWCGIKFSNATSNPAYYSLALTLDGSVITNLVIPEGVSEIGDFTFSYNTSLKSVSIPSSVTKVGKFEDCVNLKEIIYNAKNATCTASPFQKAGNSTDKIKVVIGASVEVLPAEIFANNEHITALDMSGATALTEICDKAFFCAKNLEGVTSIPETVKTIGLSAFDECKKILVFDDGVYYIGTWAVSRTNSVPVNFTLRDGTVGIAQGVFYNCASLQNLTLPASLKTIGVATFRNCPSLISIRLAENSSLTYVGGAAFYDCKALTTIRVHSHNDWAKINFGDKNANPLSLSSEVGLYCGTEKITELVVSDVDEIGSYAFSGYLALTKADLQVNKRIGNSAFEGCEMIERLSLASNSDVTIEDNAFFNLKSLKSLNYHLKSATIGEIYNGVFYNAGKNNNFGISVSFGNDVENVPSSLFKTKSSENAPNIKSAYFVQSDSLKSVPSCFRGIPSLKVVSIPEGFSSLDGNCFTGCTGLTSITLPSTITEIGGSAFSECTALTSINLPEGVTKIGTNAFSNSGITSIEFPSTLKVIGNYAFYKCNSLTSIGALPDSLTEIGDAVFFESTLTGAITIPESVTSLGYGIFIGTKITEAHIPNNLPLPERMFERCSELTAVTIPSSITKIEGLTFSGCSKLSQITIPSGVTSIGASAFEGCSSLTSINLPEGLTEVGKGAFKLCSKIGELNLPSTLVTIDDEAFAFLKLVTKIVVPKSVKTIGKGAFGGCSALRELTVPFIGSSADLNKEFTYTETDQTYLGYIFGKIDPDGVKIQQFVRGGLHNSSYEFTLPKMFTSLTITSDHIPTYSLSGCDTIQLITIECDKVNLAPNSITSLKELVIVDIKGTVSEIPSLAFSDCTKLQAVRVSDNKITKIGSNAFSGCTALLLIPVSDTLETIGVDAFSGCASLTSITLPASLKSIGVGAFVNCSSLNSVTFTSSEGWSVSSEKETFSINPNLASRNATYLNDTYKDYAWTKQ